ncbi:MAG: FHA domain-containing protein, partial [Antricoccus sp.]
NVHKSANDLDADPPTESTHEPSDATPAAAEDPVVPPPPAVTPTLAEEPAPDPAEGKPDSIDATAPWSDPEIAMLQDGPAQNGASADPAEESAAEGRADLAAEPQGLPAGAGAGPAAVAAGVAGSAAGLVTGGALLGAAAANPAGLPSLTAAPSPWAKPDVTGTQDEQGAVAGAESFEPAADHLRIDLLNVPSSGAPTPLPTIPTCTTAGDRSDYPTTKPSSGVLVFDDGSTFALDQTYVLGRRPDRHELVQSGQARPLTVVDPDTVLSGAHASIRVQDGQVYLQDLGSLNGTHVAFPGETDWTRVEPDQSVRLVPGTRLLFGWTVATYSGSGD